MAELVVKTIDGRSTSLSSEALDELRSELHGALCLPGEAGLRTRRAGRDQLANRGSRVDAWWWIRLA